MISERNQILIQRCVDNECTIEERRLLMTELDRIPDGWKTLACTFMEDALFAQACSTDPTSALSQSGTVTAPAKRHWFHHPAISIALSACVVLLMSVILIGDFSATTPVDIAQGPDRAVDNGVASKSVELETPRSVAKSPTWLARYEVDGASPQELTVYDDPTEFVNGFERFQQNYRRSLSQNLRHTTQLSPEIYFLRLPTDDGQSILMPVRDIQINSQFQ